jgi:hypothetical protein
MEKQKKKKGNVYIQRACYAVGVTRSVYYNAINNQKNGIELTPDQLDVLVKYKELIKEAEAKKEILNS